MWFERVKAIVMIAAFHLDRTSEKNGEWVMYNLLDLVVIAMWAVPQPESVEEQLLTKETFLV
jgi:hypothetical protein